MNGVETKLRKFISELITPFNDKVGQLGKEVKKLDASTENNLSQLSIINGKLDREQKVRDQVGELNVKMLTLVSQ